MNTAEQIRPFLMITSQGYWGKGTTAIEAAKNANVNGSWVTGALYKADQALIEGEINSNGFGDATWTWSERFYKFLNEAESKELKVEDMTMAFIKQANGKFKVVKGELINQLVID